VTTSIKKNITGKTYGEILDKSVVNIKLSQNKNYEIFSSTKDIVNLISNHPSGENTHNIDIKLIPTKSIKPDLYRIILDFEVEQI
jgi:hypothetical protein